MAGRAVTHASHAAPDTPKTQNICWNLRFEESRLEIIRLVEQSHLSVHRTLEQETADELAWVKGHENLRRQPPRSVTFEGRMPIVPELTSRWPGITPV